MTCAICAAPLSQRVGRGRPRKYCPGECQRAGKARRRDRVGPPPPRECDRCGESYQPRIWGRTRFCSKPCGDRAHYESLRFGLHPTAFREMLERQQRRCAICGREAEKWHLDHDHKTGKARGVLCPDCNYMLGWARDNPSTLERAADYLRPSQSARSMVAAAVQAVEAFEESEKAVRQLDRLLGR